MGKRDAGEASSKLGISLNKRPCLAYVRQTAFMTLDLHAAQQAFESALQLDAKDGPSVSASVQGSELRVEVRHQDVDALRGFDVVAKPLESEEKSGQQLGQDMAEVVKRELAYGQLPARAEDGTFKRIVV